jgi:hypothetical protein
VLSVQPDMDNKSEKGNHSLSLSTSNLVSISDSASTSSSGKNEFWLVRMEKPGVEVVTKAQMVDHYTQILMKVLGKYVVLRQPSYYFTSICLFSVAHNKILSSLNFSANRMPKLAYITFHGRGIMVSAVI